jgi:site-specific DNA-methyltransferase (adenine-specific)
MILPLRFLNQVICDDCINFLKLIPSNSIDLVITSPPYYKQRVYDEKINIIGCEKNVNDYINNLEIIFRECLRVIKTTGSVIFNIGDKYENDSLLLVPYKFAIRVTETTNAKLINDITWVKPNPQPRQFKRRLVSSTESFFHFVKDSHYKYFPEKFMSNEDKKIKKSNNGNSSKIGQSYMKAIKSSSLLSDDEKKVALAELDTVIQEVKNGEISSFRMKIRGIHSHAYGGYQGGRKQHIDNKGFTIIRMKGETIKRDVVECPILNLRFVGHPAIYPEYIIEEILNLVTENNDIVLDPFLGSGTTAIVAKRMGRRFIGIDINPTYCKISKERIQKTIIQKPMELWMK